MLLRKGTWQEAGQSLKRVHKDRRARKHVLAVGALAIIPVLCLVYLVWLAGTGAIFLLPLVLPILWWRSRREKQDVVPLHIVPPPEPVERLLSQTEQQAVRKYFAGLALVGAVLVNRAGSESYLREKEMPDGVEVTTRRVHLQLLRERGLWEEIAAQDRELMMLPDGHWEWQQICRVAEIAEQIRLLRWILRLDFYLPLVGQQLKPDYGAARKMVDDPGELFAGRELATPAMLEAGIEAATTVYVRCLAEGISRGNVQAMKEETAAWAKQLSADLAGKQHEDIVLGDKLVSEATDDTLMRALSLGLRRREFLRWCLARMEGSTPPELPFPCLSCDQ